MKSTAFIASAAILSTMSVSAVPTRVEQKLQARGYADLGYQIANSVQNSVANSVGNAGSLGHQIANNVAHSLGNAGYE